MTDSKPTESSPRFALGDVVCLRGSPLAPMTVCGRGFDLALAAHVYDCAWHGKEGRPYSVAYREETLRFWAAADAEQGLLDAL